MDSNQHGFWQAQRTRLLFFIFCIMSLAMVINLTVLSERTLKQSQRHTIESSKLAADLLTDSLTGLIFNFQMDEAKKLLREFTRRPHIAYARILDPDRSVIMESGRVERDRHPHLLIKRDLIPVFQQRVGYLEVELSGRAIAHLARTSFWQDAFVGSTQLLLVILAIYWGTSSLIRALGEAHDKMRRQAGRDLLTGIRNRRGLTSLVEHLLRTQPGARIGLVHMDLDRFKSINDSLGHTVGDRVLCEAVQRMETCLCEGSFLARIGGDEFLLLRVDTPALSPVQRVASRMLQQFDKPLSGLHANITIGVSAGVTQFQLNSMDDFHSALQAVDIALYEAKNTGRGKVVAFNESLGDTFSDNEALLIDLQTGIDNDQIEPFFQPQVDASSGKIFGVEALVRWRSPERGLVPPFQFLGLAKDAGLLARIDEIVFSKSLEALVGFRHSGLSDLRLNINLSSERLMQEGLALKLAQQVNTAGLTPEDISLEILETVFLDSPATVVDVNIRMLQQVGFKIELDDFGTGRASIANLTNFPVSKLKIDRHFITDINTDPDRQKIMRALLGLARELNIAAVAEGVETQEECSFLQALGCHKMQGFLFAKPMEYASALDYCTKRNTRANVRAMKRIVVHHQPKAAASA